MDPRPRTRATRWFVLAFTDALRRSPAESSQIFEKLSLACHRDRPARILPSLHSLGQFLVSPKIQFVVRDLSIFGTTLFTVFFERVHSAYGLMRLPWRIVKKICIYPLEPREGHNWIGNQSPWSGSSDPSHRPAHSVATCFLRLPPFRGRCSLAKLAAKSLFYGCSPVVVVSSPASYVYRSFVPSRPRRFRMWHHLSSLSGKFAEDAVVPKSLGNLR